MANAIDIFKKFYSELNKVLPMIISALVTQLYSSGLLSGDSKGCIDALPTHKEKTEYFLDSVIKPGLEIECTEQFDEMLKVMRTSDEVAVKCLFDKIEEFMSTTSCKGTSKGTVQPATQ